MSNEYLIIKGGEILRLRKGMTSRETEAILGKPFKTVECTSPLNKKLIYRINKGYTILNSYVILFNEDFMVYVAKIN